MKKLLLRWLVLVVCWGWATHVAACAICAPSDLENTLSQRLFAADVVVLATPTLDGVGYRAEEAIKGELPKGVIRLHETVIAPPTAPSKGSELLLYSAGSQTWRTVGALKTGRADWVKRLLALGPVSALNASAVTAAWLPRLSFLVADLESSEPLVAQTAYEEISLAPYAAMRPLQPHLDAHKLVRWLDIPSLAARRPLYALLLGIAGGQGTADALETRLLAGSQWQTTAELSGLFAAYLELRGADGVGWLERHYLADSRRSELEIQAAILALSVHGNGGGVRVGKDRVVQAYAVLIQHNKARAGFVASDLGNWGRWEFGMDYAALLKSREPQAFASRYAMVLFLMRSPAPEARAALDALRAGGFI
ncbi:MAG: hypothetical protein A3F78_17510 [Burkholderiales bacterium RIFCSPLOWO2_12_FULL_61_40]|nr:MAG: hypothetical protein A3F78_17510 [Burkholderiales bacterium RIFCSPLOWO2_12_FULL_61_40]